MRLRWLVAVAALAAASQAQADVTVRYALGADGHMPQMVIEMNDRGDARMTMGAMMSLIVLDGVTYMIGTDAQGRYVARWDDLVAIIADRIAARQRDGSFPAMPAPPESSGEAAEPVGRETVGGRTGTIWRVRGPDRQPISGAEIVISEDADLAPVGRLFARQYEVSQGAMQRMLGWETAPPQPFGGAMNALLGRGTPIRMGRMLRLESVDRRTLPAGSFVLPSPLLTRAEIEARGVITGRPRSD